MKNPKVQIVVPVYNASAYLRVCLDSIKNQTYTNWEAILVDDASTDNSSEIIKEYANSDSRFIYVPLEKNGGVSRARNHALSLLDGDYTAFLDSDDFWDNDMLSSLIDKAVEKDLDVVQCRFIYDFPGGRRVLPNGAFNGDTELYGKELKRVYTRMMTGINMNHVCMKLIRTTLIKDLKFDTSLKTAEDLKFCIDLFKSVKGYAFIDKPMYHYRRSDDSLTGKGLSGKQKLYANRMVALHMADALKTWGIDSVFYRLLCAMRPYVIIVSKVFRMIREKFVSKK